MQEVATTPEQPTGQVLKTQEKRWQDEIGQAMMAESFATPGARYVYERQFDRIVEVLDLPENGSLLEIGCGGGQFLTYLDSKLGSRDAHLTGLDISSLANVRRESPPERTRWITADGEDLPFTDDCFDVVVFNGSLHHMPDYDRGLREAFRVLAPHGQVVLYEPIATAFSSLIHRILDPIVFTQTEYESPVDQHCKNHFRLPELRRIAQSAGYAGEESWHDFLAYPLTGCYAGTFLGRRVGPFSTLMKVEQFLQRIPLLSKLCDMVCWRLRMVIRRA